MGANKPLPMKIDIKVTTYSPKMSEETYCFMADVLVNGKLCAQAKNQGHGGNTHIVPYSGKGTMLAQAEAYCAALPGEPIMLEARDGGKQMPYTEPDGSVKLFPQSLESVVDDLFDKYVREVYIPAAENKRYKRVCSTKTIYRLHSDPGADYEIKQLYSPGLATHLRAKYPNDLQEIINERFTAQPLKK